MVGKFYKCIGDGYGCSFEKGKIYHETVVGINLENYPEDWKEVLPYPNTTRIIKVIESGKGKTKVLKALKQWKNNF